MKNALHNLAHNVVPGSLSDLWPEISTGLSERKSLVKTLRARPLLVILIVLLIVLLFTGAAYAIGLLTGYIPGIGFVQTNSLRVLVEPVSQTRQAVTVTIEQVVVELAAYGARLQNRGAYHRSRQFKRRRRTVWCAFHPAPA